jgi:hypothetical protein
MNAKTIILSKLNISLINYDGGVYGNINQLLIVCVKIK